MVQTVRGSIPASEMGVTLSHEHIFIDLRPYWTQPASPGLDSLVDAKVSIERLGDLVHHPTVCKDNLVFDDLDLAAQELSYFKGLGGNTIIDVTSRGLGPRPLDLRAISERTGLNIISGCGYSVGRSHPSDMSTRSVDQIADEMIKEIREGIGGTDVRAGIIGELGTSQPVTENERKVLRAAAHAHKNTGVAINVHFYWRGRQAPEVLRLLESEGVDPAKVILDHQDGTEDPTLEYFNLLAERGAFVAFDGFGEEHYNDEMRHVHPRDVERVRFVVGMIEAGHVDNILLSHDIAHKNHYRRFGGHGFGHILRTIVPMLRERSVTEAEIKRILVENPMRSVA